MRKYRKRSALCQKEVAILLGVKNGGAKISRYEQLSRTPSLQTALGYEVIFQQPFSELFPGLHQEIQAQVRERAKQLLAKESKQASPVERRKLQTLRVIVGEQIKN